MGEKSADRPAQPETASARQVNWFRAQLDRVQTKWVGTIGVVLFLTATAAFGGLNAVADAGPPQIHAGEELTTPSVQMTVEAAYLADRVEGGVSIDSESDQRVLAVRVRLINLSDVPRQVISNDEGLGDIRVKRGPGKNPYVSRPGESAAGVVTMQPGVADVAVFSWAVDPQSFAEGDEIQVVLPDPQEYWGQFLDDDLHWTNEGVSAVATVTLEDIGEGDPW